MNYFLFSKGFFQRRRESVLSLVFDPNMTPTHSLIFERLLTFAFPFAVKLELSNGTDIVKVELPQGSMIASTEELVILTHCCKKNLFKKLRDLCNFKYILCGSFNFMSGKINYTRRFNQYQKIYIEIINYKNYVEIGEEKFSSPKRVGEEKFSSPKRVGEEKFSSPILCKFNNNNVLGNLYNNIVNNNKQQQQNVVVIQKIFFDKTKSKLPQNICYKLLNKYSLDHIKTNILQLHFKNVNNPIGLLIKSLEENYEFQLTQEEKIENEKRIRDLKQKKELEEYKKEIKEEKQRLNLLESQYNALPKEIRRKLRNTALKKINQNFPLDKTKFKILFNKMVKHEVLTMLDNKIKKETIG